MKTIAFNPGDVITLQGEKWRIDGFYLTGEIKLVNCATGQEVKETVVSIVRNFWI